MVLGNGILALAGNGNNKEGRRQLFFVLLLLLLLLPGKVGAKDEGWVRVDFPFHSFVWGCGGDDDQ